MPFWDDKKLTDGVVLTETAAKGTPFVAPAGSTVLNPGQTYYSVDPEKVASARTLLDKKNPVTLGENVQGQNIVRNGDYKKTLRAYGTSELAEKTVIQAVSGNFDPYYCPFHIPLPPMAHGLFETRVGFTRVRFYVPEGWNEDTQFMFLIHGNGGPHQTRRYHTLNDFLGMPGFSGGVYPFRQLADQKNIIMIAPLFDREYFPIVGLPETGPNLIAVHPDEHGIFKKFNLLDFSQANYNERLYEFLVDYMLLGSLEEPGEIVQKLPWYQWPKPHLIPFQAFGDKEDPRSDHMLLNIFRAFRTLFPNIDNDQFHIFGHSAGAQFIQRFMHFYWPLLKNIYISAPGKLMFPCFGRSGLFCKNHFSEDWNVPPWSTLERYLLADEYNGFYISNLEFPMTLDIQPVFHRLHLPDLNFERHPLQKTLASLMKKKIFLLVGQQDDGNDVYLKEFREIWWQGFTRRQRLFNYRNSMLHTAHMLFERGYMDRFEFNIRYIEFEGVDHVSGPAIDFIVSTFGTLIENVAGLNPEFNGPVIAGICDLGGIRETDSDLDPIPFAGF